VRGWLAAGVAAAILGSLLVWNGLSLRFGPAAEEAAAVENPSSVAPMGSESIAVEPAATEPALPGAMANDSEGSSGHLAAAQRESATAQDPVETPPSTMGGAGTLEGEAVLMATTERLSPPKTTTEAIKFSDLHKRLLVEALSDEGWPEAELTLLRQLLRDPRAEFRPKVLMVNVTHEETEAQYAQHLTPEAVDRCQEFWQSEGHKVARAVDGGRVPPSVVAAILRVETNFGQYRGKESVFNVYFTLALGDRPQVRDQALDRADSAYGEQSRKMARRAEWARSQLRDLLYMMRSGNGVDPLKMLGSWAGAFGLPQFIPTSYRAYGRDGNRDGVVDLDDVSDAAASIAYYLQLNGWPDDDSPQRQKKVIMTYNHSVYYADCVLALADSLNHRWGGLHQ